MKVWLIGANGMLGSTFPKLLCQEGIQFVTTTEEVIDITDAKQVSSFITSLGITHVINCAAYTQVDLAETERKLAHKVNAEAPKILAQITKKASAHLLHFSTDYVFNGASERPFCETDRCDPINYYGLSKLIGEQNILSENQNSLIIRTSWLFSMTGKNFVSTILRLLKEKDEIAIVNDQVGRPTYCPDLASIALKLFIEGKRGLYHCANTNATSWYDFAEEIQKQAVQNGLLSLRKPILPIPTSSYPTPATRPALSTLDTEKLERIWGKEFIRPWQMALTECLNQYKEQAHATHTNH